LGASRREFGGVGLGCEGCGVRTSLLLEEH
jgi:hypothetical protein